MEDDLTEEDVASGNHIFYEGWVRGKCYELKDWQTKFSKP